jgi:hypothetical protein
MKNTFEISSLDENFFNLFDKLKIDYFNEKRKPLRYYRCKNKNKKQIHRKTKKIK